MDDHDTAPRYLLLPIGTNLSILDLAAEIYDVVARCEMVEVPTFTDALPPVDHSAILNGPIMSGRFSERDPSEQSLPSASEQMRQDTLIRMAKEGKLTTKDIQLMSMEDYAIVRNVLLMHVDQALQGKTYYEKFKAITNT
jgi:hypothetical protein